MKVIKHLLIGILLGAVLGPSTTHAQWTVFDPAQYSLQIERQIEEANRWLERVRQYSEEINKLAEQLSTMKGVLGQAEKLVLHNANLTRTMAQIGQTVRDVFALKRAIETMVITRLRMIKSAFSSDRDGNREIYVMDADGSHQTRLTNNAAQDDFPAFSRDGTRHSTLTAQRSLSLVIAMDRARFT